MKVRFRFLQDIVEKDIIKLFKTFRDSPATFLSESDVECYLYSLLTNEPQIRDFQVRMKNMRYRTGEWKASAVHTNMLVDINDKDRRVDISIFQPKTIIDWENTEEEWENMIGIEIKFDISTASTSKTGILEDIKKVADYREGYVLWLNWQNKISDDHHKKAEEFAKKHNSVKLFYLDVFSDPIKTNVPHLLD